MIHCAPRPDADPLHCGSDVRRGKALSSQTAHGHQASRPRPSVFAQDDGRRTEPATTELRRMVPRVGARPNAA